MLDPSGAPGVACILILPGACPLQGMLQAVVAPEEFPSDDEAGDAEDAELSGPVGLLAQESLVLGRHRPLDGLSSRHV